MPILTPEELTIEAYHNSLAGEEKWLSKTTIKDFLDMGPKRWYMTHLARSISRPKKTEAMEQGSMIDCWLTEGEAAFHLRYVVAPVGAPKKPTSAQLNAKKPSPETLDAIAYWTPFAGKVIVSQEDYLILLDAIEAIHELPMWPRIKQTLMQRSVRRFSPGMGLGLQSRPDFLELDGTRATTFDLKKVDQYDRFSIQAIDLQHHTQAAIAGWCLIGEGFSHEEAFLIPVEWERGARAEVFDIPTEALDDGFKKMKKTAEEISERIKSGDWMPVQTMSKKLPISYWHARKMAEAV